MFATRNLLLQISFTIFVLTSSATPYLHLCSSLLTHIELFTVSMAPKKKTNEIVSI